MDLISVELHFWRDILYLTIHPYFQETFFPDLFKQLAVMAFPAPDQRSQQRDLAAIIFLKNIVNNLILAPLHHLLTSIIGIGLTGPCKQEAKEIINFCYS